MAPAIASQRDDNGRVGEIRLVVGLFGALGGCGAGPTSAPGCGVCPSRVGPSFATDCGRSELLTLRHASIADRKPARYVPFAACVAGGMWSTSTRNVASSGRRPVTAR